jgi:hypothetical protein
MKNQEFSEQIYSFWSLRKSIGWIGISLPFALMTGVYFLFKGPIPFYSISQYYFSGMRNLMTGALCAIALFLFFYKGYNRWDLWSSNLAAISALGIAFCPTVKEGPLNTSAHIHFISATIFFLTLACISLFLFTKKSSQPTRQKKTRNGIYIACGLVMIGCLLALLTFYIFFENKSSHFVFWIETLALVAFGVSWLVKGQALFADEKK